MTQKERTIVMEYKELCCSAAGVNDLLRQVSTTAVKQQKEEEEEDLLC